MEGNRVKKSNLVIVPLSQFRPVSRSFLYLQTCIFEYSAFNYQFGIFDDVNFDTQEWM